MSQCFPKSCRLRKRADFLVVQRAGKTLHSRYFVVVGQRAKGGRLGITVSKKVGNAVIRNRIKRLVREFARTSRNTESWVPEGLDVVVIAKRGAGQAPTAKLWSDLQGHRAALSALNAGEKR